MSLLSESKALIDIYQELSMCEHFNFYESENIPVRKL
jgi:hypothetical protein